MGTLSMGTTGSEPGNGEHDNWGNDTAAPELTVVVADGQPVMRSGLSALCSSVDGIRVVAEAATGRQAVHEALVHRPDVLLLDLELGELDGVTTITEVLRVVPEVAVLVFTRFTDDASVFTAMRAGARGYLLKGAEQQEIVRAIHGVAAGEAIFGAPVASRLAELLSSPAPQRRPGLDLTTRETEVLDLIARGLRNSAIARRLHLAPKTITNHISAIFAKLGVTGRTEAIALARAAGLGEAAAGEPPPPRYEAVWASTRWQPPTAHVLPKVTVTG